MPVKNLNTVPADSLVGLAASSMPPATEAAVWRKRLTVRDELLQVMGGDEDHDLAGKKFAFRPGGRVYEIEKGFVDGDPRIVPLHEVDPPTGLSFVLKKGHPFAPEDTRVNPPRSGVRNERSDSALDRTSILYDIHQERQPLREIAAHVQAAKAGIEYEAYPGVKVPLVPALNEVFLHQVPLGDRKKLIPYLVIERVPGVSLGKYLETNLNSRNASRMLADVSLQVLEQLDLLAQHGVVHCDTRERNILVKSVDVKGRQRPLARLIDLDHVCLPQLAEKQGEDGFAHVPKLSRTMFDSPREAPNRVFAVFKDLAELAKRRITADSAIVDAIHALDGECHRRHPLSLPEAIKLVKRAAGR